MLRCATGFGIMPKIVVWTRAYRPAIRSPDGDRPTRILPIAVPLLNPGSTSVACRADAEAASPATA
ncbi:hypothetical protein SAMN05216466_101243 [Paraburkholderia phenazinium]|jgi:hypothetical protein|uniref:Uncharacterized protein n=1 Tax=Paraburkholderia phenazinium TaxID=60549 RepID=A0A1G7PCT2_9BURK|nr:hypothetical protein SAMN05216466_101243 [Paraburkholderia phenazinium]